MGKERVDAIRILISILIDVLRFDYYVARQETGTNFYIYATPDWSIKFPSTDKCRRPACRKAFTLNHDRQKPDE